MYEVRKTFTGKTEVWMTEDVLSAINDIARTKDGGLFARRLQEAAKNGFSCYEHAKGFIRHKKDGVFGIQHAQCRFRIYGFYDGPNKAVFVAVEHYTKPGQKLGQRGQQMLNTVAEARNSRQWRKLQ